MSNQPPDETRIRKAQTSMAATLGAAQKMAGKNYFCELDCFEAYHCIQMAEVQSVRLLSFNFGSRNFALKQLVQVLNRSQSNFSSAITEYSNTVVKADRCAQ